MAAYQIISPHTYASQTQIHRTFGNQSKSPSHAGCIIRVAHSTTKPTRNKKTRKQLSFPIKKGVFRRAYSGRYPGTPDYAREPHSTFMYPHGILGFRQSIPGYPKSIPGYPKSIPGYPKSIPGYPKSIPGYPQSILGYPHGIRENPRVSEYTRVGTRVP